jgi:hypothetical protein
MPLTPPAARKSMHRRRVECQGYLRDDGWWDIEGHLVDTKPFDIPNPDRGGTIRAGEHLHEMWIRLTVDTELLVHEVEAKTDFGPYSLCGDITDNFKALVGLRIASGWTQKTRELLGGVKGCTHLVELLGPVATTAFQTVYASRAKRDGASRRKTGKPPLLDTCHAYRSDGPIVQQKWPEHYTGTVLSPMCDPGDPRHG